MAESYLDVTLPITAGMVRWPSDPAVSIEARKSSLKGDRSRVSLLRLGSHTGTHVDAPRHYLARGRGVDEARPETLIGPCQVVDCRGLKSVSEREVAGLDVAAAPRVLFRTDNSRRLLRRRRFFEDYVSVEEGAARTLIKLGAVLAGVDGFSMDAFTAPKPGAHLAMLKAGVVIVELLCLDGVAPGRYGLICLPLRIKGCDGSPARAFLRRT